MKYAFFSNTLHLFFFFVPIYYISRCSIGFVEMKMSPQSTFFKRPELLMHRCGNPVPIKLRQHYNFFCASMSVPMTLTLFSIKWFSGIFRCFLGPSVTSVELYSLTWSSWSMQGCAFFFVLENYSLERHQRAWCFTLNKIPWINTYLARSSSWEAQLAIYILSGAMQSFASEKLDMKRLGHFSKAVMELNFLLEYFKSEFAFGREVLQSTDLHTAAHRGEHTQVSSCHIRLKSWMRQNWMLDSFLIQMEHYSLGIYSFQSFL